MEVVGPLGRVDTLRISLKLLQKTILKLGYQAKWDIILGEVAIFLEPFGACGIFFCVFKSSKIDDSDDALEAGTAGNQEPYWTVRS